STWAAHDRNNFVTAKKRRACRKTYELISRRRGFHYLFLHGRRFFCRQQLILPQLRFCLAISFQDYHHFSAESLLKHRLPSMFESSVTSLLKFLLHCPCLRGRKQLIFIAGFVIFIFA